MLMHTYYSQKLCRHNIYLPLLMTRLVKPVHIQVHVWN